MGFWNWFKSDSKARNSKRKRSTPLDPKISQAFGRVKRDMKKLRTSLTDINAQLTGHTEVLTEHTRWMATHTARLDSLEQRVSAATPALALTAEPLPMSRPTTPTRRPDTPTNRLVATRPATNRTAEHLDLQSLSPQEKRILQVFWTHRDMALSYQDIATSLHKSPHTIKNQIRQMNMKSSLFDKTVDANSKNRFKLRKHLKIETDLDTL